MASGKARFKLLRAKQEEQRTLQRRAGKKSLWGSIGGTLGGLAAMAFTGGLVNPLTVGALTGAATLAGGALGTGASNVGSLKGGRFFQSDREELERELGAFGTQNIVSSLKSGITAGIGQKLNLMKSGEEAAKLSEGFGLDFKGSMVGKGLQKAKTARLGKEFAEKGWIDPNLQTKVGGEPIVAMDRRTISPEKQQILASGGIADRFGLDKSKIISGETVSPTATDLTPSSEFLSTGDVAYSKGTQFHSKNVFGVGDKAGEVIPISEATPRPLYSDQKVSAWDKFKDFVDVSDVKEERAMEKQLSQYRGNMSGANVPWTPPGTGHRRLWNELSEEYPGTYQSGMSTVIGR